MTGGKKKGGGGAKTFDVELKEGKIFPKMFGGNEKHRGGGKKKKT